MATLHPLSPSFSLAEVPAQTSFILKSLNKLGCSKHFNKDVETVRNQVERLIQSVKPFAYKHFSLGFNQPNLNHALASIHFLACELKEKQTEGYIIWNQLSEKTQRFLTACLTPTSHFESTFWRVHLSALRLLQLECFHHMLLSKEALPFQKSFTLEKTEQTKELIFLYLKLERILLIHLFPHFDQESINDPTPFSVDFVERLQVLVKKVHKNSEAFFKEAPLINALVYRDDQGEHCRYSPFLQFINLSLNKRHAYLTRSFQQGDGWQSLVNRHSDPWEEDFLEKRNCVMTCLESILYSLKDKGNFFPKDILKYPPSLVTCWIFLTQIAEIAPASLENVKWKKFGSLSQINEYLLKRTQQYDIALHSLEGPLSAYQKIAYLTTLFSACLSLEPNLAANLDHHLEAAIAGFPNEISKLLSKPLKNYFSAEEPQDEDKNSLESQTDEMSETALHFP